MSERPDPNPMVVRALLQGGVPEGDVIARTAYTLLSGLGYDLGKPAVRARHNDQQVRAAASGRVAEAGGALSTLEARYREEFVPPSTREQPFPPDDVTARLRQVAQLRRRLQDLSSTLTVLETPADHPIWRRLPGERPLLEQLVAADLALVNGAEALITAAQAVTAHDLADGKVADLEAGLDALEHAISERRALFR